MSRYGVFAVAMAAAWSMACLDAGTDSCADGTLCAPGLVCVPALPICVLPGQFGPCDGLGDGEACTFREREGVCNSGVCLEIGCGDGFVDPATEECDWVDVNTAYTCLDAGYYEDRPVECSPNCQFATFPTCETTCGDGIIQADFESCEPSVPIDLQCVDFGFNAGVLECSSACVPKTAACQGFGWRRMPPPVGGSLNGVSTYPGGAIAVSGFGAIAVLETLERDRFTVALNTDEQWRDVYAAGPTQAYLVGYSIDGALLRRFDGTALEEIAIPSEVAAYQLGVIDGSGSDNVYIGGEDGLVLHYDGTSVSVVRQPDADNLDIKAIHVYDQDNVYAVADVDTDVFHFLHFDGGAWTATPVSHPSDGSTLPASIWMESPTNIYVARRRLFHFDGGDWSTENLPGQTFPPTMVAAGNGVFAVWGSAGDDLFVAGAGRSWHFDGFQWNQVPRPMGHAIHDIDGIGDQVFATGDFGATWQNDGTIMVSETVENPTFPITRVVGAVTETGLQSDRYGAGDQRIFHYEDAGGSYEWVVRHLAPADISAITFGDGEVWAFDRDLNLVRGDRDGFVTSSPYDSQGSVIADAFYGGPFEVYGVGGAVAIRFDGSTWHTESVPTEGALLAVTATDGYVYAAGGKGVYRRARSGPSDWVAIDTDLNLRDLWASSDDDIYGVGHFGSVHFDGSTWTPIELPLPVRQESVTGTAADDVYIGGWGGIIHHFDGAQWSLVDIKESKKIWDILVTG
ncbi:MAG: hypothetical protein KJO44_07195, partial [Gemmatimonadetes bacterium]|nr:hypothetical protein [Gemmatimonadota bacterium]